MLQRPLTKAVKKSAPRVARFANFAMWLGQRAGENVLIAAVAAHGREMEAEEDWGEIMKFLEAKEPSAYALIEPHESGAFSASDIPLSFWLESFKFDSTI